MEHYSRDIFTLCIVISKQTMYAFYSLVCYKFSFNQFTSQLIWHKKWLAIIFCQISNCGYQSFNKGCLLRPFFPEAWDYRYGLEMLTIQKDEKKDFLAFWIKEIEISRFKCWNLFFKRFANFHHSDVRLNDFASAQFSKIELHG